MVGYLNQVRSELLNAPTSEQNQRAIKIIDNLILSIKYEPDDFIKEFLRLYHV